MKNIITILVLLASLAALFLLTSAFTQNNPEKFYYAYEEKIPLRVLENKLIVRYSPSLPVNAARSALESIAIRTQVDWQDDRTVILSFLPSSSKESIIQKLKSDKDVMSLNPMYALKAGPAMGVTDEFLVKFKDKAPKESITELIKRYAISSVKRTDVFELFRVPKGADALEIANKFQESGLVVYSQPNFITQIELHQTVIPIDEFFNRQYYLNNTGQIFNPAENHSGTVNADIDAPEAWGFSRGNNAIVIAVLDEGVTADHPDLPNTRQVRLNGSNYGDGDPNNPNAVNNNNHGNSCAGIIAATHNNEGVAGIAPNCRIMPVRIFNGNCTGIAVDRLADAIDFARRNGADVISNSWGYNSANPNLFPAIVESIRIATTQGRNNLGCVVVFSAGNTANLAAGNGGFISFPSNVNIPGVLTIGASDRNDIQANYSPTSNPNSNENQIVDLVAPSHRAYPDQIAGETMEVWTIDIPNNTGYNPYPADNGSCLFVRNPPIIGELLPNAGINFQAYTGRFGGTSASCPQVAGVAALILSANPSLTQQQVFDVITNSADRVGGYVYTNGRSNELGAGRLNACLAVREAVRTALSVTGPTLVCSSGPNSNQTFTLQNPPPGTTVSWTASANLTLSSGNGTTATVSAVAGASGSGWVDFTITGACGNVTARGTTWVGEPSHPGYIYGPETANEASLLTYYVNPVASATSYTWTVPSGWSVSQGQGTDMATIHVGSTSGYISVLANNLCGDGQSASLFVQVNSGGSCGSKICPESFTVAPNPADDYVEVTAQSSTNDKGANSVAALEAYEVKLFDNLARVRKQGKARNGKARLETKDLPEGIYYLHIFHQEGIIRKQILIRR